MATERDPLIKDRTVVETTSLPDEHEEQDEEFETLKPERLWVLPALAIGCFLSAADQTIVLSSYGSIGSELDALSKVSWLTTAYLIPLSSFQILYGRLSDIFGRRNLLIFAYATFGLGSLFCGLAQTMDQLIIARALAGVGGGGFNTLATIVLADLIPLPQRGIFQGYRDVIFAIGLGIGTLSGFVTETFGWRWSFLLQIPLILTGILNTMISFDHDILTKKECWVNKVRRVDFIGAFLIILAVSSLLFGIEQAAYETSMSYVTVGCLITSFILFTAFFYVEINIAVEPFAPKHVFLARTIGSCISCGFFTYGSWISILYQLPLYWQAVEGKSPSVASVRLLPGFIPAVLGSLVAGLTFKISGRYYWPTILAFGGMNVAILVIMLCSGWVTHSTIAVVISLGICGFFLNVAATSNLIALMANSNAADLATAISCLFLFRSLGTSICLAVVAATFQHALHSQLWLRLQNYTPDFVDDLIQGITQSLSKIDDLSSELQGIVRNSYEVAIGRSLILCLVFAALAFLSSVPIKERKRAAATE